MEVNKEEQDKLTRAVSYLYKANVEFANIKKMYDSKKKMEEVV